MRLPFRLPWCRLLPLVVLAALVPPAVGQTTTITGTAGSRDSWNTASNWNNGVPSGSDAAVVAAGVLAQVDNDTTPTHGGGLTLEANARLQIGWTTNRAANVNAVGTGAITMNDGSEIISRAGLGNYDFTQAILLPGGNATIWSGISTTNHGSIKTLTGGISGPGMLTWNGVNRTWGIIDTANPSWTGGFATADPQNQRHRFRADANGCFGTGDVTIGNNCSFYISGGLGDTIDDGAAFSVSGIASNEAPAKLVLDSDETVNQFWLEGVQQPAGTYHSGSGLLDSGGGPLISGSGVLTVLEDPGAGLLMLLSVKDPADGGTDVREGDLITATFSKPVVLGTGAFTLRNLTDGIDTVIPVNDPRLTVNGTVVTIDPGNALLFDKSYAIRVDPDAIDSDTGISFAGIADDIEWNFDTLVGDPLFLALEALGLHIDGTAPLNSAGIETHTLTIEAEMARFDESAASIQAVFDLVEAYDTTPGFGPLWVNTGQFDRNADNYGNLGWAIYLVSRGIMDEIYTSANLAAHEGLLDGFQFGSAANFPGSVDPPSPAVTRTATIDGSYLDTAGWPRQHDDWDARKPTGNYLAPGTIATVTVPPALVNAGYKIRVGAHSWDHEAKGRRWIRRVPRCTTLFDIDSTTMKVANPLGGGIYIEVPYLASAGVVNIDITGAVQSPFFSAKDFHETTLQDWLAVERHHPAPWADFQSEKFMMQVPTNWIYNLADPVTLVEDWDRAVDIFNDLMGFPRDRGKESLYEQVDVLNRSSVLAPGYPTVNTSDSNPTRDDFGGDRSHYLTRGPQTTPDYVFHEAGHAYFFPKFGGESESNVNLPHVAIWHRGFGFDLDTAHAASRGQQGNPNKTVDGTAMEWMLMWDFYNENEMKKGHKVYQLKGHAKFVDFARLFGWEALGNFWKSFVDDYETGSPDPLDGWSFPTDPDSMMLRMSRAAGADVRPLIHFWGIFPDDPAGLAADLAAEGLLPSPEIHDLLEHYKALIPADNAGFRDFTIAWWGRQPVPGNSGTEWEHGRQWDDTLLVDPADAQRPNGEIFDAAASTEVTARLQLIIDEYFPSGDPDPAYVSVPHPNPMGFVIDPHASAPGEVTMRAMGATDLHGPIEYFFENITSGNTRGWSTDPDWTDQGLAGGVSYDFRVKARNSLGGETAWSATVSATAVGDETAPFVVDSNPVNGAVGIPYASDLTLTFNEDVMLTGSGTVTIRNLSDASDVVLTLPDGQVTVSGTDLVIDLSGDLLAEKNYAVRIAPSALADLSGNPFAGIEDDLTWAFSTGTVANATTITGAAGSRDSWNTASNWDFGVPSGSIAAFVAPGVLAQVDNNATPTYSGGLTLGVNARLQVGWTTNHAANKNALGTGPITMGDGSEIIARGGLGTHTFTQPIFLAGGNATIWSGISTSNHNSTKTLSGGISGPGMLTWNGVNNTWGILDTANPSWTGGFQTGDPQNQRHQFRAAADGCFGSGDVAINNNCSLYISSGVSDAIDDGAVLSLNGVASSNAPAKLVLETSGIETVGDLWIDGVQQAPGDYTGASGFISGSGTLRVIGPPPATDYDNWAAQFAGADLADPGADLDGDGRTNDEERLFGTDPTSAASVSPISVPLDPSTGTFSYTRRDDALTGAGYTVWTSTTLQPGSWVEDTGAGQLEGAPDANGVETVVVTLSAGLLSNGHLFVQVRAAE